MRWAFFVLLLYLPLEYLSPPDVMLSIYWPMVSSLPELVACCRPPSHSTRPQSTGHYDCFIRLLPQNPEPHILSASPFLLFKLLPDPSPPGTRAQPPLHSPDLSGGDRASGLSPHVACPATHSPRGAVSTPAWTAALSRWLVSTSGVQSSAGRSICVLSGRGGA